MIITISFTSLNTYYLIGQQKKDSLIQVARSFEIEDTVRFNILRNLSATSSDLDDKLSYGQELFAQAKKSNDIKWQAFAKILSGTAYRLKSDLSLALTEYLEAANLAKSIDHEIGLGQSYLNMADVYSIIDNHDGAIRYYHQAILVLKKSANYRALSAALVNLGDHYFNQNQPDSALFYFETVQQYDAYTTVLQKAYNLGNIGLVNAQLGKYDLAENRINEASRSLSVLKEFYPVCVYLTYLADIYASKGETERAINFTKESLRTSLEYGFKEQIRDAYKKLNSLYAAKGDIENAYYNHLQYVIYKDSVSNLESVQKMADLQTQFEVGQKQTEVDLLTAEKRTQQIITWAIAAFALILIVLAAIIYKYYQAKAKINLILESQKSELERLNETKDKFFSIISHDLRGPISAFQGVGRMIKFALKKENKDYLLELSDDIDESAFRLSSLLDGLLSWALQQQGHFPNVPEKVALSIIVPDLMATFKNTATSKGINLSTDMEEDIQLWVDKNTTETIIRNLLNNALKFTPEGGEVTIYARVNETMAVIEVRDTGVGIPKEKLEKLFNLHEKKSTYGTSGEKGLGLGLQLVYEFIEMNNGRVEVQSEEEKGTVFIIQLPLFHAERSVVAY